MGFRKHRPFRDDRIHAVDQRRMLDPDCGKQKKQADLTLGLRGAAGTVTVSNINVEYIK